MELRNFDKLSSFIEAYKNGDIIYRDGALYRTIRKINRNLTVKLDEPKMMRVNTDNGYWRVTFNGITCYEHAVIYAIFHGIESLKRVECIDHVDTNKKNNNIDNLEGVTIEENNKRAKEKGLLKNQKGSNNNASTISDDTVLKIRELWNNQDYHYTQREIGKMFGISQATVSQIVTRVRRGDI